MNASITYWRKLLASASALTAATSSHMEDYARAATARLSAWVQLVQAQLTDYSAAIDSNQTSLNGADAILQQAFAVGTSPFTEVDIVDGQGQIVASDNPADVGISFGTPSWLPVFNRRTGRVGAPVR
jgi:hypothetical protein